MIDIQTERVLEAAIDEIYSQLDCENRDQCPAIRGFMDLLQMMKEANNHDIMRQIGEVRIKHCPHLCSGKARKKSP